MRKLTPFRDGLANGSSRPCAAPLRCRTAGSSAMPACGCLKRPAF